jgi:hypothetical protein
MLQRMVKISARAVTGKPSSQTRDKSAVGLAHFKGVEFMDRPGMCELGM